MTATAQTVSWRLALWHKRSRRRRAARKQRADDGFVMIEFLFFVPVLVLLLSLVVLCGRIVHAQNEAEQAAADAARAASLQRSTPAAQQAATNTAQASLTDAGVSCHPVQVTVSGTADPGSAITVTVTCTAALSDLAIDGIPGTKTFTATATSPVEVTRGVSLGFSLSEGRSPSNRSVGV